MVNSNLVSIPDCTQVQYQVGGSLNVNNSTYVVRQADNQLYQALLQNEFCYVFNCRQMGKSSLRVRVKNRLQQDGYACVSLDMTNIGSKAISPGQWYKSIAAELWRGFNLIGKVKFKAWWESQSELSPVQHLNYFISDVILPTIEAEKVLIFIDEIDSVLSLEFPTDDFFALIRYFYNARAELPQFNRLSFALFGVATPSNLISDRTRTPFNIGKAIELTGFTETEATPLVRGLIGGFKHPEIVLREILKWTGGQPFLTQKVCKLAVERSQKSGVCSLPGQETNWVKDLVIEKIITNWESQDEPEHLRTIRDRLLGNEQTASRLLGLAEQILRDGFIFADDSPEQRELLLTNLVVKQQGKLISRNLIYQQILNLDWLTQQADRLRPYGKEVEFWLNSNCQDNSRLLRGKALQEAQAWANNHSISQTEYQFLTASQEQEEAQLRQDLELKRLQEIEARLLQEHKLAQLQQFLLATVGAAFAITVGLGAVAYINYRQAKTNEIAAKTNEIEAHITSSESLFDSEQRFESLIHAIDAKTAAQKFAAVNESTSLKADFALQQAAYNVIEKNTFSGHQDIVNSVSYSPDGKLIASASSDNTIKLWRTNGEVVATSIGHEAPVADVQFTPDGQSLISGGFDRTLRFWQLKDRANKLTVIEKLSIFAHQAVITDVAISPDGELIASVSHDRYLKLWQPNGRLIKSIFADKTGLRTVAISPNGQTITTGGKEQNIKLWNLDGELITILRGHRAIVLDVEFSPDGNKIASASADKTIKIWNKEGELLTTLRGHQGRVWNVDFSPDGNKIVSAAEDKQVKLWDLARILQLDPLEYGCDWIKDYLQNNPDRGVCE